MRGQVSLDLLITGIFVLSMFGLAGTLTTHSLQKVEAMLAQPACLMYAHNIADAAALGTVTVVDKPKNVVSVSVTSTTVRVEVNGITGTHSCEVKIP